MLQYTKRLSLYSTMKYTLAILSNGMPLGNNNKIIIAKDMADATRKHLRLRKVPHSTAKK